MSLFDSIRQRIRKRAVLKELAKVRNLTVGEVMTKYVITIKQDDDVVKAATKMIAEDISCLVVMQENAIVGVLSERDFQRKAPLSPKIFQMKVKDIMRPEVVTIAPEAKLPEAVALMINRNVRRLIVMQDGKMTGIVTQTDFTKTLSKVFTAYPVAKELQVDKIMSRDVLMTTPKGTVADAKQRMLKANVGCILIADKGTALGIFTEYDVVMQFYDQQDKLQMNDIGKYMRKYVRALPPDASIFEANKLMLEKNMRRVLIVEGEKIVGIVTQTDICRKGYSMLDTVEKAANGTDAAFKRFAINPAIHGEFHGDHLKVYSVE
jgi:CBS domain-containing protein